MRTRLLTTFALLSALLLSGCAGGWRGAPPAEWAADAATAPAAASPAAPGTTPAKQGGSHATADGVLFLFKGEASSVNVAGDFNAWSTSADALKQQADGSWQLQKALAAGKYTYKFVVNGSDWKTDEGVTEGVDDGFGGKNSVVTVTGSGAAAAAPAAAAPVAASPAGAVAGEGGVTFRFTGTGASVHLAGEFNSWSTSADPLKKQADGSWTLTKALPAGKYAYKFVIDGTAWKEDANATEFVDDGYGGKNSIVVVGAGAAAVAAAPAAAPAAAASAATAGEGGVTFRFTGTGASVHLAGEFNSWSTSADPLKKQADGSWTLTKALPAGKHAYKFVIDGTAWKEDANATEFVDDGYGGKNSIVVVGAGAAGAAPASAAAAKPATPATKPLSAGVKPRAPQLTAAGVVFTFAGAANNSVAVCGDFNQWAVTTDKLAQQPDGSWTLTRKLAPGTYAYKFLVDGKTWKVDEGNANTRDDDFGSKNSVLVVK